MVTRMILFLWLNDTKPVHPHIPGLSNLDLRTSDWSGDSLRQP